LIDDHHLFGGGLRMRPRVQKFAIEAGDIGRRTQRPAPGRPKVAPICAVPVPVVPAFAAFRHGGGSLAGHRDGIGAAAQAVAGALHAQRLEHPLLDQIGNWFARDLLGNLGRQQMPMLA